MSVNIQAQKGRVDMHAINKTRLIWSFDNKKMGYVGIPYGPSSVRYVMVKIRLEL